MNSTPCRSVSQSNLLPWSVVVLAPGPDVPVSSHEWLAGDAAACMVARLVRAPRLESAMAAIRTDTTREKPKQSGNGSEAFCNSRRRDHNGSGASGNRSELGRWIPDGGAAPEAGSGPSSRATARRHDTASCTASWLSTDGIASCAAISSWHHLRSLCRGVPTKTDCGCDAAG